MRALLALGLAALVVACGAGPAVREDLDPSTGITWTANGTPIAFASTDARYSRSARDYVYVGPVEVNRQGVRDYYLWVGIATTLDRGYLAPEVSEPDRLYVVVRGEVMEFALQPWASLVPLELREPVYPTAVAVHAQLAARITADQIMLLDEDRPGTVRVASPGGRTREYVRWDDGATWQSFALHLGLKTTTTSNAGSDK